MVTPKENLYAKLNHDRRINTVSFASGVFDRLLCRKKIVYFDKPLVDIVSIPAVNNYILSTAKMIT